MYIYIVLSCSIPFQPKASPNTSPNTAATQKGPRKGRPAWGRLDFGQRHFVVAEEHLRGARQALRPLLQEELQHGLQHPVVILQLEQEAWSRCRGWEGIKKSDVNVDE